MVCFWSSRALGHTHTHICSKELWSSLMLLCSHRASAPALCHPAVQVRGLCVWCTVEVAVLSVVFRCNWNEASNPKTQKECHPSCWAVDIRSVHWPECPVWLFSVTGSWGLTPVLAPSTAICNTIDSYHVLYMLYKVYGVYMVWIYSVIDVSHRAALSLTTYPGTFLTTHNPVRFSSYFWEVLHVLTHREMANFTLKQGYEFCLSSWLGVCIPFPWLHVKISYLTRRGGTLL